MLHRQGDAIPHDLETHPCTAPHEQREAMTLGARATRDATTAVRRRTRCPFFSWAFLAVLAVLQTNPASAQWPQWGGPDRNFSVDVTGLAETWPDDGPKKLWTRPLGDGYSTIVADDGVLYTMYRNDPAEFTIALNAKTGETI